MRGEEEKKRVGNCCHVKGEGGGELNGLHIDDINRYI